jgi:hypothetical protein
VFGTDSTRTIRVERARRLVDAPHHHVLYDTRIGREASERTLTADRLEVIFTPTS